MLFAISRGAVEGYAEGQNPVIYLCSTVETVQQARLRWVFTEGHADMDYTDFFDDLKDLDKVDWALMKQRYWNDTNDDPDRKRRRQAEFLGRGGGWSLPVEVILGQTRESEQLQLATQ